VLDAIVENSTPLLRMMKTPQPIDAVPHHLWFSGTSTSSNVPSHEQSFNSSNNAGTATHNSITVSVLNTPNSSVARYVESKTFNGAIQVLDTPIEQPYANSFKNFQGPPPPPPQPQLPSPNNHELLLHTFQQWKPSQTEVPPSPQNQTEYWNSEV
jgi:hypothetical protein